MMNSLAVAAASIILVWFVRRWYEFEVMKYKLRSIPTVGSSNFLLSYFSALKFMASGHQLVTEGYKKYPGGLFKIQVPTNSRGWAVMGSGTQLVEDIRRAGLDQLSFFHAASDSLGTKWIVGNRDDPNHLPYHFDVVRVALTRAFPSRYEDIRDEIQISVREAFDSEEGWKEIPLFRSMVSVVSRTSNRLFVGLPLCRNQEYLSHLQRFTLGRAKAGNKLQFVPQFLKPLVGKLISPMPEAVMGLEPMLGPMIRDRLNKEEAMGSKWPERPKDLLSWLLDYAPQEKRNVSDLMFRIISLNFVSVHTTSITVSNALFDLASHTQYIEPLREEAQEMVGLHGWTKESVNKMRKLDSFLKESSRMRGIGSVSMSRKVLQDFTLSDGTVLPAGCVVNVAARGVHHDSNNYVDPLAFDGYRFLNLRDTQEGGDLKYQMVSLDHNYLLFGLGRSACPGRFFAVNEAKAIIAHILLNYDIELPQGCTEHPEGMWFSSSYAPNPAATLMVRKRKF